MIKAVAGVDIGSLTAKAVILDHRGEVLASSIIPAGIVNEKTAEVSLHKALRHAHLSSDDLAFVVTTGYGRTLVKFGNKNVTEISCHARGAHYLLPAVRTVIDIGGQDSKAIVLDSKGKVVNFTMNDKCAAGTGRFLEVMARALGVELEDLGPLSLQSRNPAQVSSVCTVFAESEIISLASKNVSKVDIIAGLHESIGRRIVGMAKGVGVRPTVMMSGGVAKNQGIVQVLNRMLGTDMVIAPEPQIVGALGAALFALEEVEGAPTKAVVTSAPVARSRQLEGQKQPA
ncbi:MAG: 2-hydroxyglutaryl-CoA dehydratase [Chloroflexi bacterium]|nr:2-hydroxyglutaryl-CoA dehydratase [Chloroflexota bacterium]